MNLTEIKRLSPVAIEYIPNLWYRGGYDVFTDIIMINSTAIKNSADEAVVLLHEIGHAICVATKCRCRKTKVGSMLREYHAYKSQITRCLGNISALTRSVQVIQNSSDGRLDESFPGHAKACKRLVKTKLNSFQAPRP